MAEYEDYMKQISSLIVRYEEISNSHMVDFITENLWEKAVPKELRFSFENYRNDNCTLESIREHPSVIEFYHLLSSKKLCNINSRINSLNKRELSKKDMKQKENLNNKRRDFHTDKKWHEVDQFSKVIKEIMKDESSVIIDAGAGKGYLSAVLSENDKVPVLAIESSSKTYHSALNYQSLRKKKANETFQLVKYVMKHIDEDTNYTELVKANFPNLPIITNFTLVGLHTCGSLAYAMAKSFIHCANVTTLCMVPCCYHLANKTLNEPYTFSKNQRMLAQQKTIEICSRSSYCPSLFYRAVLQVILRSLGINSARVGRGAPVNDFLQYVKWAFDKLGIPEEKRPSSEYIQERYKTHLQDKWKFDVFHTLRLLIAPIIEAAILTDILLYIHRNVKCTKLELKQVFDESISPRSYALIATK